VDANLFYAVTTISTDKRENCTFWDFSWLNGRKPKDIGPLIFEASIRKNWKIKQAMHNNAWISKIKKDANLYIPLDKIIWNLTASGEFSTTSAYNAQFFGVHAYRHEQGGLESLAAAKNHIRCLVGYLI
jgi:hypothetical protein